jgi:hypothetical protein
MKRFISPSIYFKLVCTGYLTATFLYLNYRVGSKGDRSMINWKDLRGSDHGLIEVLSQHLPGRTERKYGKKSR